MTIQDAIQDTLFPAEALEGLEPVIAPTPASFYWLAACSVTHSVQRGAGREKPAQIGRVNILVDTQLPIVPKHYLGIISARAVAASSKKLGYKTESVTDVVIDNVIFLGRMTEAEFNATPSATESPF